MSKQLEKPMHFKEVQEFLGMGSDFIYKNLQSGVIPGRKLGGRWIVRPSDLQKYLDRLPSNNYKLRG
ncbi:MAG: helix-turn-helix domain-containing protein [Syntrophomonas sp.]